MAKPESPALAAYWKQRKADEAGQKVCRECKELFDAETPKVRWCPACRAMLRDTYLAEAEVILAKLKVSRAKTRLERKQELEAELEAAGKEKCPRCRHIKDAYDGFSLCEDCRTYYRERRKAQRKESQRHGPHDS